MVSVVAVRSVGYLFFERDERELSVRPVHQLVVGAGPAGEFIARVVTYTCQKPAFLARVS